MAVRAAILGATGVVGQRFVQLLDGHPWIKVEVLAGRSSAGKRYSEAVKWVLESPMPGWAAGMEVEPVDPEAIAERVDVAFSALPRSVAAPIEEELARRGVVVASNAGSMRLDPDVPLLNGEVNWEHVRLVDVQRGRRGYEGAILKNPNCTTAILTLFLKPLMDEYGVKRVVVTTLQAITGAGLRGLPAAMIVDNVIPYIEGEEAKVKAESRKILGSLSGGAVEPAEIEVEATTTRVPVIDGHTEVVYVELGRRPGSLEEVEEVLSSWRSMPQEARLPTAPERPLVVRREPDRPQPRLDRYEGRGMSVVVGRLDWAPSLGENWIRAVILGHNTVRGAAGAAILAYEIYRALYS